MAVGTVLTHAPANFLHVLSLSQSNDKLKGFTSQELMTYHLANQAFWDYRDEL
jgi:hypothetical protein